MLPDLLSFSRMFCKCFTIKFQLKKMLFLSLTFALVGLLKLYYNHILVTGPQKTWLVEPFWSTSQFVRNRKNSKYVQLKLEINCTAIYESSSVEVGKTLEIRKGNIVDLEDEDVELMTSDCAQYLSQRGYQNKLVSEEEKEYPLAFSMVVHKDAIMVERSLRMIYMPQNIYCIHYDQKSSNSFKTAIDNLAKCFPNVFIASKLELVHYAHISRLQADLNCLSDLLQSSVQWKYVINLCGQDLPLRSNFELVSELKKLNGANMLESMKPSDTKKERFTYRHELQDNSNEDEQVPFKTGVVKEPAPHNIKIFTGSAYFVLSYDFVKYITHSIVAKDFLAWSADTYSPDEHFWATMVRVPGVPGELSWPEAEVTDLQSKVRLVKWSYLEGALYPPCTGTHRRSVCIYGSAELNWLLNYGHWFANKFDSKVDPVLIKCLELKISERQKNWIELTPQMFYIYDHGENFWG
ncbi:beta-1,3-galactosyl-O-glycosyl-glycoprotein beta-1,6-N-acetylglucosaminyltransferase 4-like isoform X4 [Carcharodon carcharias]|uniref:beta-1,3-galactosyl-O-glycosyl-glycoprotein beta-1,6-N-acetylglucosaminyltransferase 4-like isoform X4 n=1 Tax=Carcharodon carcharias TaxID=13397 RepID=UPI001B7F3B29|nr:beta-1,3-galactosyl-O-glycosyl-glycoprotein beta-1,6-N-acetylglucosaminyltransferase 4-like isoform X4 [Carcharodon carcharias]